jgi:hypothetical protein
MFDGCIVSNRKSDIFIVCGGRAFIGFAIVIAVAS